MKTRSRPTPTDHSSGKIILICKLKGGAGATTSVRELAAAAVADGLRTAIIDLDGQGGLTRWWNRRTKASGDAAVRPELLQILAEQIAARSAALRVACDLVLIDSPPSVHATILEVASVVDLALIPSRPNVDDLDAVGPIFRLLHGVVDIGFILTQVPGKRSLDGAEALERLAAHGPVLGRTTFRAAYARPPASGATGFETDDAAREEIGALYVRIRERLALGRSSGTSSRGGLSIRSPDEALARAGSDQIRVSPDHPTTRSPRSAGDDGPSVTATLSPQSPDAGTRTSPEEVMTLSGDHPRTRRRS